MASSQNHRISISDKGLETRILYIVIELVTQEPEAQESLMYAIVYMPSTTQPLLTFQFFLKLIKYNRDTSFYCFHHTCKLTTVYTVSEQRNNCIITKVPNYQVRQPVTDYFGEVIFTEHRNNFQIILYFQVQSYIMRPGHANNCNSHTKSPSQREKKTVILVEGLK